MSQSSNTQRSTGETVEELAARTGHTVAELEALLGKPAQRLVRDHIGPLLAALTQRTRETYGCHYDRMLRGVGPVCDQICAPCLVPVRTLKDGTERSWVVDFPCRCSCADCRISRITIMPMGDMRVCNEVYSKELVVNLSAVARRYAVKSGIVANRGRAQRGMPPKQADGHNAAETAIAAARCLYLDAGVDTYQDALKVKKPARAPKGRRSIEDFEFAEMIQLTETSGNDPELDGLILAFGIATSARTEGVPALTVGKLRFDIQMCGVIDKGKKAVDMPVSRGLLDRLLAHAIERGGPVCDPTSPLYVPDSPVFYYRRAGKYKAITERRIDYIIGRWQKNLPWARAEQLVFHHIRHTMGELLCRKPYGPHYKKTYLRHADNSATDIYGKCDNTMLARAMCDLLGFEHPLVHGTDARRKETLERLGLE
jgi:integrase